MAVIHKTTLTPGKLELLAGWLPGQPWYVAGSGGPELDKAGGFRLDDPAGAVGIEFIVVSDAAAGREVTYLVPLTYRGRPLDGAEDALIGTAEHGVLGRRWVYDGVRDPVLVAQLVALIQGAATPQHQSRSHTADPSVTSRPATQASVSVAGYTVAADAADGTELLVRTTDAHGRDAGDLVVRINRVLRADADAPAARGTWPGQVAATWGLADGTRAEGVLATAREDG